jgi:ribosome biogenesis GTPase
MGAYGRHQDVEDESTHERYDCSRRGRLKDVVCGDRVAFTKAPGFTGVIDEILPRKSLLYRSDAFKQKALAANIDIALILTAPLPKPREILMNRCLIAAIAAGIRPIIVCNKADHPEATDLFTQLQDYAAYGVECLLISALGDLATLTERVTGVDSIVIGESGMGKSTLINALLPQADLRTGITLEEGELGKHTTTHARRLPLPQGGSITDTPGMQVFGLQHLSPFELEESHPEFRALIGTCRFRDCHHDNEPGCAFKEAAANSPHLTKRLQWLREIRAENERISAWARPKETL